MGFPSASLASTEFEATFRNLLAKPLARTRQKALKDRDSTAPPPIFSAKLGRRTAWLVRRSIAHRRDRLGCAHLFKKVMIPIDFDIEDLSLARRITKWAKLNRQSLDRSGFAY